jgi:predicted nucleotidyltransferase
MQEKLRKLLTDNDVFDIVVFGSSVKGAASPRDYDAVVIFRGGELRDRLNKVQGFKEAIDIEGLDIKQTTLNELFSSSFFARTGILLEGISIKEGQPFCNTLGFAASTLYWYTLSGLTHNEKIAFNYAIYGRRRKGLLAELQGQMISRGAVKVPIKNSLQLEEALRLHKVSFRKKNILEEM